MLFFLLVACLQLTNGLESVSQTLWGTQSPWLTEKRETIILSVSFRWRKRLPCLLSELADGPAECEVVKAQPAHFYLFSLG